jgi:hypothetical protein
VKDPSIRCTTTRRRRDGLTQSTGQRGKKKPKAKLAQPSLAPLSEPPQNVEVIRKPRKEKPVVEDDTDEA